MSLPPRPPIARFMEKVDRTDGCWLWTAALLENGYGLFRVNSQYQQRAHRWAYEHFHGQIPVGAVVMHTCDVKRCVNPDHLRVGTQLENQQDMTAKGRGRNGLRNGWVAHAPKLSQPLADEIRTLYASGGATQEDLANEYGVAQTMISRIVRGRAWSR